MKCIDLHSHVIPTSIIEAIRAEPRLYERDKTAIEGEGRDVKLVRGKKKFDLEPENYDVDAKLESMDRKRISETRLRKLAIGNYARVLRQAVWPMWRGRRRQVKLRPLF